LPAPVAKLTKKQILWLSGHKCEAHGHRYLDHYTCYVKEHDAEERVGFLDIESSNLNADYGIILTYCIKDSISGDILHDQISKEDIESSEAGKEDKRLMGTLLQDLAKFDKIVTYYGVRFDLPFIRTRAMVNGLDFLPYGALVHKDVYFAVKAKFKLSSSRLENACRVLLGKTNKTRIDSKNWAGAQRGDPQALEYVLKHNKFDVIDLEKLYHKVEGYGKPSANSI